VEPLPGLGCQAERQRLDGDIEFPTQRLASQVIGAEQRALAFTETADALAVICWLHRDALVKRLDAEIDAEADDKAALSHADREVRSAEVQCDILEQERLEAAAVWLAQSQGLLVEHRPDCSALAILGCRLITAPRASNGHTSPEHGFNVMR
jgi:hypothetical protein